MDALLLCLCGCGRPLGSRSVRQLRAACYMQALKDIKAGKTTWADREAAGTAMSAKDTKWNFKQFMRGK